MSNKPIIIVGLQWGDEGKGKIVDLLSQNVDYVVRFNGGNNAGHTVKTSLGEFKFHHLPSGALHEKEMFLAQGEVINPQVLLEEINQLKKAGIKLKLMIDPRCHIVMPYHKLLDAASENWKGKDATGSLKLGIGYCYEDKNNRQGIRFADLADKTVLEKKLNTIFPLKKAIIEKAYSQKVTINIQDIVREYYGYGCKLREYSGDVSEKIINSLSDKKIIFEGAHGVFLDPAFGSYPYTVAPYCIASSAFTGIGLPPLACRVYGIFKAYTTRVGNGPFPTEQFDLTGEKLQISGQEFGTTSGRKRRCGWLDLVMLKHAVKLNGCTDLIMTKLDVLSGFSKIKAAVAYRLGNKQIRHLPPIYDTLNRARPVYREFTGWNMPMNVKHYSELPVMCRRYLKFIENELEIPIKIISIGPDRLQNIYKN